MGQLTPLIAGKLVAFDTGPLIYYIEEHPDYLSPADELFGALDRGVAHGMTSVLTLQEVLLDGLVAKETAGSNKVILPLWHKVSKDEVMSYSPTLADKVALNTAMLTIDELATELGKILKGNG